MAAESNWYHAHIDAISRGDGKTAIGLVAYVTGEKIKDEETGKWCKRNHPGEVLDWGTVAPSNAAAYLTDKDQLGKAWNDVQRSETRINSHLAQHWNIASSREFTETQHTDAAKQMAQSITDRYGVMVTWSVHKPTDHGDDRNWHIHLAYNMRRIGPDGFGEKAREITAKASRVDETRWQRRMFAEVINRQLEILGSTERVSHLSYAERGIGREPTEHLGDKQNQIELKGEATPVGDFNRAVRERNAQIEAENAARASAILNLQSEIIVLAERRKRKMSESDSEKSKSDTLRKDFDGQTGTQQDRLKVALDQGKERDRFFSMLEIDKATADREREARLNGRTQETDIVDPHSRYLDAVGRAYDIRRPESSLAQVVGIEGAAAKREHDQLTRDAAQATDPDKKQDILLRRDIQHADYMAITSERLAGMSRVITGNPHSEQATRDMEAHRMWTQQATALREERQELQERIVNRQMDIINEAVQRGGPARSEEASIVVDADGRAAVGRDFRQTPMDRDERDHPIRAGDTIDNSHARGQEELAEGRTGRTPNQTAEASIVGGAAKEDPYAGLTPVQRKEEERLDQKVASVVAERETDKSMEPGVAADRTAARGGGISF